MPLEQTQLSCTTSTLKTQIKMVRNLVPIPSVSCMRVYQSYTQGVGVQIKGGIIVTLANPITGVLLVYTSSYYSKATPSVHIVLIIMRQLALALQSPFFCTIGC